MGAASIEYEFNIKPNRASQYVSFVPVPNPGKKTKVWNVIGYRDGDDIGIIKWAGNWRKYVYYIQSDSYYDWDCLRLIADFCEAATKDHRVKK